MTEEEPNSSGENPGENTEKDTGHIDSSSEKKESGIEKDKETEPKETESEEEKETEDEPELKETEPEPDTGSSSSDVSENDILQALIDSEIEKEDKGGAENSTPQSSTPSNEVPFPVDLTEDTENLIPSEDTIDTSDPWLEQKGHQWPDFVQHFRSIQKARKPWEEYKKEWGIGKKSKKKSGGTKKVGKKVASKASGNVESELSLFYNDDVENGYEGTFAQWLGDMTKKRMKEEGREIITQKKYTDGSVENRVLGTKKKDNDSYRNQMNEIRKMNYDMVQDEMNTNMLDNQRMKLEQQRLQNERERQKYMNPNNNNNSQNNNQNNGMVTVIDPIEDGNGNIVHYDKKEIHKSAVPLYMKTMEQKKNRAIGNNDNNSLMMLMKMTEMSRNNINQSSNNNNNNDMMGVLKMLLTERSRNDRNSRHNPRNVPTPEDKYRNEIEKMRLEHKKEIETQRLEQRKLEQKLHDTQMEQLKNSMEQQVGGLYQELQDMKKEQANQGLDKDIQKLMQLKQMFGSDLFGNGKSPEQMRAESQSEMARTVTSTINKFADVAKSGMSQRFQDRERLMNSLMNESMPGAQPVDVSDSEMDRFIENGNRTQSVEEYRPKEGGSRKSKDNDKPRIIA